MAYAHGTPLGIAPAVAIAIVQDAPSILAGIAKLFGESGSYDQTHAQILSLCQVILRDPQGAVSGQYLPGDGRWLESAANAYLALNCWAGNQAVLAAYRQVSGDPAPNGCGCEVEYGCRADAQQALATINRELNRPAPSVSNAPIPSQPGSVVPGGTVYGTLPGGIQVGVPVPVGTITGSAIGGVPILAWLAIGLVGAYAFGGSRR